MAVDVNEKLILQVFFNGVVYKVVKLGLNTCAMLHLVVYV